MLVTQLYLTLWNPLDWGSPDSSVHGILQARVLKWVAISFSNKVLTLVKDWGWGGKEHKYSINRNNCY